MLLCEGQHGAQVIQVQQRQPLIVGDREDDLQHTGLRIIQFHQPRQQKRPHF